MTADPFSRTARHIYQWWLGGSAIAYLTRFVGVVGGAVAFRELLEKFNLKPFPVTAAGLTLFGVTTLAVYFAMEFFRLLLRLDTASPDELSSAILRHLDLLLDQDKHESVVRYHAALSRLLWVEGQLKVRIEIGKRISSAAAAINDCSTLMGVLIDDLGWTYVALHDYNEAKINILRGIELADEHKVFYWAAKGHRHLAGIAVETNDSDGASKEFSLARTIAEKIEAPMTRLEMLAGIDYGEAVFLLRYNRFEEALKLVKVSEERRREVGDESRIVKVFALRGEIEERMTMRAKAAESFHRGLRTARKIGRVDEEIRCLQGLARIEKDPEKKETLEREASLLKASTPIAYEFR